MDFIRDCVRKPVQSIDAKTSAKDAAIAMGEKRISALLVTRGEDYVGIISKTDLVTKLVAQGLDPNSTHAEKLMTPNILKLDEYISRGEANEFMSRNRIKHLAVTSQGKIIGMVTLKDLVS